MGENLPKKQLIFQFSGVGSLIGHHPPRLRSCFQCKDPFKLTPVPAYWSDPEPDFLTGRIRKSDSIENIYICRVKNDHLFLTIYLDIKPKLLSGTVDIYSRNFFLCIDRKQSFCQFDQNLEANHLNCKVFGLCLDLNFSISEAPL